MKTNKKYVVFLLLAILMFSAFEVVSKTMHGALTPSQLTFYRFLTGGIILLPFAVKDAKAHKVHVSFKLFLTFLGMGLLLVCLSMTLCQVGLQYTNASITAVLFSSNPLFISLFSSLILKEKLSRFKLIGLFVGIIGLVLACGNMFTSPRTYGSKFMLGLLIVFLAMIIFSLHAVINKKLTKRYGVFTCLSSSSILGAITLIPVMIYNARSNGISNPFAFDIMSILPQFIFISVFVTGIAYYLYYDALANVDTSLGSMSFFIKPPLASILAAIFLNETIPWNLIAGIICIVAGVMISVKLGNRPITKNNLSLSYLKKEESSI